MMSWEKLINTLRLGNRPAKDEQARSPFNSDHDKIIFSGAFRRLARKTQVHPLANNDHVHNRLTHSLEVACVGRSLGIRVWKKLQEENRVTCNVSPFDIGDIIQSTCLAHDIGNPPFGHTGEAAIRSWFQSDGSKFLDELGAEEANDLRMFEGNAQGFRVLTSAEYHPYDGGMRLTYATLASFIKYPWTSLPAKSGKRPQNEKFGVFQTELKFFEEVADAVGLIKQDGDDWYCRHPLVHLMELADDFCYALLDLEDALEMNIMSWDDILEIYEPLLSFEEKNYIADESQRLRPARRPPVIRGKIIDIYVEAATEAFIKKEKEILDGKSVKLLDECGPVVLNSVKKAKQVASERIFNHPRKIELEIGSYSVISTLLEVMCTAVIEYVKKSKKCSFKSTRVIALIGKETFHPKVRHFVESGTPSSSAEACSENYTIEYLALMRVIDFVSGCTDHYATYLAKQFNGLAEFR